MDFRGIAPRRMAVAAEDAGDLVQADDPGDQGRRIDPTRGEHSERAIEAGRRTEDPDDRDVLEDDPAAVDQACSPASPIHTTRPPG